MSTEGLKRAGDYTSFDVFREQQGEPASVAQIAGRDVLLHDYTERMLTRDEGDVWGIGLYVEETGDNGGAFLKVLSWSKVLYDQAKRIPKADLPIVMQISEKGTGTRKFWSMS